MGRTMAVVLFTDLVGSTELRGRLGEEAADELRRRHDQLLAQAVEANNGRVVKGLGDGIMATFGGASDGVAAAVAIQQAVDRFNRTAETRAPVAVRVGLSAGDVAFEDDDVHGTPVIEASRLCAAATGGEILVSEVVKLLGGFDDQVVDRGRLELKGLQKPVAAWEVPWEPAAVSTIPLPSLLTDIGRIFVGRDAELERLGRLWKEAAAGERRVVLLAGEPGVGKTRLAAELAIRVHDEGSVVLAGRCDEDLGVPYQPFVEALRHFVDHTPPPELPARLGRYGGELSRLLPELAQRVPDLQRPVQSDPETERYRLFDAIAAWLSAASVEEPLLLVLDDLQWAAKPTLLLLRHIARASDVVRLFIVGTYRDTELTHDHPLVETMADLRREQAVDRLPLSGLDDLAVSAIVEQAAGHALDQDGAALTRAIYQETEGNPFFVRELLRHLAETKAIYRQGDRWTTRVPIEQLGIPEGVRDVVGRRLSRLSPEANQALRVAAVVGTEFEVAVVQTAGDFIDGPLLAALDEAVAARLVTEVSPARFRFSHALVRATLYESLTGARKVALHRQVAEATEKLHEAALDDYLPALAHHWARASAPAADTAKAVDYGARAGDRALVQLAYDEAAVYYQQALDLLDPTDAQHEPRRLRLLIALGEALRRAGNAAHRRILLQAAALADAAGDAESLARAALANNRGIFTVSEHVDTELVSVQELALERYPPADSPTRARLLALLAEELAFSPDTDRRSRIANEALAIARRVADPPTLAQVLVRRYTPFVTTPERHAEMVELAEIVGRLDDPALVVWSHLLLSLSSFSVGDTERYTHSLAVLVQGSEALGQPVLRWFATFFSSSASRIAGALQDAEDRAHQALELGRAAGMADTRAMHTTNLFFVRYDQGQLDDLLPVFERAGSRPDPKPVALVFLGLIYRELGRIDEANELLKRLAANRFGSLPKHFAWIPQIAMTAEICAGVGDRDHAATLRTLLLPHQNLVGTTGGGATGAVAHQLGLLATVLHRFDEAEAHFIAAVSRHEPIPAPTWLARTRLEWARMLLKRRQPGDADRARELLGQALGTARELGLAKVERDAVALLR